MPNYSLCDIFRGLRVDDLKYVSKTAEAIDNGTKKFRKLIYDFLDPGVKEAGNYIADKLRFLRFKNSIKAMKKAKRILYSNGIDNITIIRRYSYEMSCMW